jgi:hypothetical protein
MVSAVFFELATLTKCDRGGELGPKQKERLRVLRGFMKRLLTETGVKLSKHEDELCGLAE